MAEEHAPGLCLAVDIGGTKIAAGVVDRQGMVLWQDRTRTPRATDPEALFRVVADLIHIGVLAADARGELATVGIGCGGPIQDELVSPLNIGAWRSFPLAALVRALPDIQKAAVPVALDNDAKALALGEGWVGSARGERNFLAMVVSTGVGGGLVVDGGLLGGSAGNAGHIGHMIVEPEGRECSCGARGCLEAEASGAAIEAFTGKPAAEASEEVRERAGRLVGRAVASVCNLLDIRHCLVGGSVALGYGMPFFLAAQRELAASSRLAFTSGARIDPVGLGGDAPIIGAAALGWRALGDRILDGSNPASHPA
ncbi:MAG: ROK family protein [Acidimicrobiales bacterium]